MLTSTLSIHLSLVLPIQYLTHFLTYFQEWKGLPADQSLRSKQQELSGKLSKPPDQRAGKERNVVDAGGEIQQRQPQQRAERQQCPGFR